MRRATEKSSFGPSPVLSSAGRGWTGIQVLRFKGYVEEFDVPPSPNHTAVVNLTRHPVDLVQRLDGKLYEEPCNPHGVTIAPAGTHAEVSHKDRTESDVLNLLLEDALLRKVAKSVEVDPDGLEIVLRVGTPAPQIERIGLSLNEELEADGLLGGKLYAESLANAFALTLIRDYSSLGRSAIAKAVRHPTGGLSRRALNAVIDYVGDNLANKGLTLAEMAGTAHMSPYHFSRLFKESTGLAPHQYVIERRIQRAKELLCGSALPIAEIALLCGFANQSHLNRHFKRLLGVNPKALR